MLLYKSARLRNGVVFVVAALSYGISAGCVQCMWPRTFSQCIEQVQFFSVCFCSLCSKLCRPYNVRAHMYRLFISPFGRAHALDSHCRRTLVRHVSYTFGVSTARTKTQVAVSICSIFRYNRQSTSESKPKHIKSVIQLLETNAYTAKDN